MISFVIPAHNEEDIILDTLTRLREAARGIPHEIIVSDDGSTDGTADIAARYADHVVRYNGEQPKTIGAARNRGARATQGDVLFFLDSDVRIHEPQAFLPKIIEYFESNPELVAMTSSVRVYPKTETWGDRIVLTVFDTYFRIANNMFNFGLTHGKCMIVRRSAFQSVNGFNEHLVASEDADLFMRLAKKGRAVLDPSLRVHFSGRRAHALGWPKLLTQWVLNGVWIFLFKRSYSGDWKRRDAKAGL